MSEAQPLHHQAFFYLRGVYGDDPRLVDLTQAEAVSLWQYSTTYLSRRHERTREDLQGVGRAFIEGTPPQLIGEQMVPAASEERVRSYVANLALRVVSSHQQYIGGDPSIPRRLVKEKPIDTTMPGRLLSVVEENHLFEILHEEEMQRARVEQRTGEPQPLSNISQFCYQRIVDSWMPLMRVRLQHTHGPSFDAEELERAARQGVIMTVQDYIKLSDRPEFGNFLDKNMKIVLRSDMQEKQSVTASASSSEIILPSQHYERVGLLFLDPWRAVVWRGMQGLDGNRQTAEELAEAYGVEVSNVKLAYRRANSQLKVIIPLARNNDPALIENYGARHKNVFVFLAAAGKPVPFSTPLNLAYKAAHQKLKGVGLPEVQRQIIEKLYGLHGDAVKLVDVSAELGLSKGKLSDMEQELLREMTPNSQAQYYLGQLFGDGLVIPDEMTQHDAESILDATVFSWYGDRLHRRPSDALRAIEVTRQYVKGIDPDKISAHFKLSKNRSPTYFVRDLARRIKHTFWHQRDRDPVLADFWMPLQERIREYYPDLLHFAMKLGRGTHAPTLSPEDAVSEGIAKVMSRIEKARAIGEAGPSLNVSYFISAIRSVYYDYGKSSAVRTTQSYGDMEDFDRPLVGGDALDQLTEREKQRIVAEALRKIAAGFEGHPQKELLWDYWAGMSGPELARKYTMTPGAVKAFVYRAREKIREMVERGEIELPDNFFKD